MHSLILRSFLATFCAATSLALAIDSGNSSTIEPPTCGTLPPPSHPLEQSRQIPKCDVQDGPWAEDHAPIHVKAHFHVVTSAAAAQTWTRSQLTRQLTVMNNAFKPYNIAFTLADWDFTTNDAWANYSQEYSMKSALHQGTYADLNLYFLSEYGIGTNTIGICYLPNRSPTRYQQQIDGCTVRIETLPGGSSRNYNTGLNAVHEVGHWFGLLHPFTSGNCNTDGDGIPDTPFQATYTGGCPTRKDSCPNRPGLDSIHNYMDYSWESCKREFTPCQGSVMVQTWDALRAGK